MEKRPLLCAHQQVQAACSSSRSQPKAKGLGVWACRAGLQDPGAAGGLSGLGLNGLQALAAHLGAANLAQVHPATSHWCMLWLSAVSPAADADDSKNFVVSNTSWTGLLLSTTYMIVMPRLCRGWAAWAATGGWPWGRREGTPQGRAAR